MTAVDRRPASTAAVHSALVPVARPPQSTSTDLVCPAAAVGVAWVQTHRGAATHHSAALHRDVVNRIGAQRQATGASAPASHATWRQSGDAGHRSTLFPVVSIRTVIDPSPLSIVTPQCTDWRQLTARADHPSQRQRNNNTAQSVSSMGGGFHVCACPLQELREEHTRN